MRIINFPLLFTHTYQWEIYSSMHLNIKINIFTNYPICVSWYISYCILVNYNTVYTSGIEEMLLKYKDKYCTHRIWNKRKGRIWYIHRYWLLTINKYPTLLYLNYMIFYFSTSAPASGHRTIYTSRSGGQQRPEQLCSQSSQHIQSSLQWTWRRYRWRQQWWWWWRNSHPSHSGDVRCADRPRVHSLCTALYDVPTSHR